MGVTDIEVVLLGTFRVIETWFWSNILKRSCWLQIQAVWFWPRSTCLCLFLFSCKLELIPQRYCEDLVLSFIPKYTFSIHQSLIIMTDRKCWLPYESQRREGSLLNGWPAETSPWSVGRIWTCGDLEERDCCRGITWAQTGRGGGKPGACMGDIRRFSLSAEEGGARGRIGVR